MDKPMRGEAPVSYGEMFRVVGAFIDREALSEVRVVETDDGLILQGRLTRGERAGKTDTYQLTVQDLEDLIRNATALRGKKTLAGAQGRG